MASAFFSQIFSLFNIRGEKNAAIQFFSSLFNFCTKVHQSKINLRRMRMFTVTLKKGFIFISIVYT